MYLTVATQQQQQQQQVMVSKICCYFLLFSILVSALPGCFLTAGKSTLVNRLVGSKVSGVSSKRNTTITPQLGCLTVGSSQVLLYDTPGLVEAHLQVRSNQRLSCVVFHGSACVRALQNPSKHAIAPSIHPSIIIHMWGPACWQASQCSLTSMV